MINYIDPARWIVLQYRPGAGGKMLLLCLMTIESIAHWDPEVDDGTIAPINSLHKYWNISKSTNQILIMFEFSEMAEQIQSDKTKQKQQLIKFLILLCAQVAALTKFLM